jgi:antirestriction protein ArdC
VAEQALVFWRRTGGVPWVQPWGTAAAKALLAMPKNASTDRQYSGINVRFFGVL